MKSKLTDCSTYDSGPPSDRVWCRLELDFEELLTALRENDVLGLIKNVLRPHYGTSPVFLVLCSELTLSAMAGVSERLRKLNKDRFDMAVLLDKTSIKKMEDKLNKRLEQAAASSYWRGEGPI